MAAPNPFRDPAPWNTVRIGGRLIKATLTKINGIKLEDEWKVQKSKETSGSVAVFNGTKILEAIELTFEAVGEEDFDDLGDLWNLLAPKPGTGGTVGTPAPTGGNQFSGGVVTPKGNAASPSASTTAGTVDTSGGAAKSSSSSTPNPGPRPPTLIIENAILTYLGVTAIARKAWEGPKCTATNSWEVVLTLIQNKPPVPAGVGAQAPPKPGSQFSGGQVTPKDGDAQTKKALDAAAAGT
jgi:hypothetical protein